MGALRTRGGAYFCFQVGSTRHTFLYSGIHEYLISMYQTSQYCILFEIISWGKKKDFPVLMRAKKNKKIKSKTFCRAPIFTPEWKN